MKNVGKSWRKFEFQFDVALFMNMMEIETDIEMIESFT